MKAHEEHLRKMYVAIAGGASGSELSSFFHPDAEQVEYPSLVRPSGHTRPLAEMLGAADIGAQMIQNQHYDVHTVISQGDQVAVQLTWTATAAVNLGTIPQGTDLVAHVAAFYVFRDGLVLRQSSYDCYETLPA